jgi:hypothetical protein
VHIEDSPDEAMKELEEEFAEFREKTAAGAG